MVVLFARLGPGDAVGLEFLTLVGKKRVAVAAVVAEVVVMLEIGKSGRAVAVAAAAAGRQQPELVEQRRREDERFLRRTVV